jgi:glutathione S-transferase
MRLYYIAQSCALASHIVANEAGVPVDIVEVDLATKKTASGANFLTINPKGYVPVVVLDDGQVLTESAAILQYLADVNPESRLAPPNGTFARVRLQEALNYIGTEIHRGYGPLFNPTTPATIREERMANLRRHYAWVEQQLSSRRYLLGDDFSVADAYLFTITRWAEGVKLDLTHYPHLQAFQKSIAARPPVRAAMKAEGLPLA